VLHVAGPGAGAEAIVGAQRRIELVGQSLAHVALEARAALGQDRAADPAAETELGVAGVDHRVDAERVGDRAAVHPNDPVHTGSTLNRARTSSIGRSK
jgi:hypothetical protein